MLILIYKLDYINQNQNGNIGEEDIKEISYNNNIFEKDNILKDDEDEDEIQSKRILNNVESYQSLGFLLPKKNNFLEKSNEKITNNRRYLNQEAYDFDTNNIYNTNNKFDSSDNILRKIHSHFLSFIVFFLNDILNHLNYSQRFIC